MPDSGESPNSGTWRAPREDIARALAGPALAVLDDLGVIEADGPDAAAFLQSQLTCDVAAIDAAAWTLGGYCNPKGRLLAVFELWRADAGFRMLLPAELAVPTARRLSMFVLRSKVRVSDASGAWVAFGLVGPGMAGLLQDAGIEVPAQDWGASTLEDGARLARLPGAPQCAERFVLLAPALQRQRWLDRLGGASRVDRGTWWWTQIDAGIPAVFNPTLEAFVPQMLNLEVLGGVSFRKGCYPGQEVVARSQYLGKLRRRMGIGQAADARAGDDIFDGADPAQPVGKVVMAAAAPGGAMDLLFECPTERAAATLHVGTPSSPAVVVRPLPYRLFDPTA
jgi:hypothetical protein